MTMYDDDEEMGTEEPASFDGRFDFIICILPRSLYRVHSDRWTLFDGDDRPADTEPGRTEPSSNRRFDDWMRACNILGRGLETLYTHILLVEQLLRFICGSSTSIVVWAIYFLRIHSVARGNEFSDTLTLPLPKRWI